MRRLFHLCLVAAAAAAGAAVLGADAAASSPVLAPPSVGASAIRMIGSLCLVFALFFGAAWFYRNSTRFTGGQRGQRKLQVLEARSLGARQSVFVVGYDQQRFLVGSTPQGMVLLSHLPEGEAQPANPAERIVPMPFTEALKQVLGRK